MTQTSPGFDVPQGACDCHVHVFGAPERYPFAAGRAYTPGAATVEALLALHAALRIERVVVVQPSPYGTDNSCMLDALARLGAARARGVAVVDAKTPDTALRAMHGAGVRGLRVNLATPGVRDLREAGERLTEAARRAAALGWHVQTHAGIGTIAALEEVIAALPAPIVFDHFGRPRARLGPKQPGFDALLRMLRSGRAWVKLSAPHRVSDEDTRPFADALAAANPERLLWGTDWPHPAAVRVKRDGIEPFDAVDDAQALARLRDWLPGLFRRILVQNPAQLYDF
jgi:predicted TIM-barrel fold metal-dependent hydrolase